MNSAALGAIVEDGCLSLLISVRLEDEDRNWVPVVPEIDDEGLEVTSASLILGGLQILKQLGRNWSSFRYGKEGEALEKYWQAHGDPSMNTEIKNKFEQFISLLSARRENERYVRQGVDPIPPRWTLPAFFFLYGGHTAVPLVQRLVNRSFALDLLENHVFMLLIAVVLHYSERRWVEKGLGISSSSTRKQFRDALEWIRSQVDGALHLQINWRPP